MKKRLAATLLAGALSVSMAIPAFATEGGAVPSADGTEIFAGIVIYDIDAKVKVEVPTLFAFVVNGTTSATDDTAVTSKDGTILLPNVKVNVTKESNEVGSGPDDSAVYEIQTVGEGNMPFVNYSTFDNGSEREGLPVTVNGNIKNEGSPESRNYWTHVVSTETTKDTDNFKNYNISIDDRVFDTAADGGLEMKDGIKLEAPDTNLGGNQANVDKNDLAVVGTTHFAAFDVTVGGERQQYKQVEQSAKVGTIVWTISAEISGNEVYTAPSNDYLSGS